MATIMPVIIGLILLAGVLGGTRLLLRGWSERRQHSGGGGVALAFPIAGERRHSEDGRDRMPESMAGLSVEGGGDETGDDLLDPRELWKTPLPLPLEAAASGSSVGGALANRPPRLPPSTEREIAAFDGGADGGQPIPNGPARSRESRTPLPARRSERDGVPMPLPTGGPVFAGAGSFEQPNRSDSDGPAFGEELDFALIEGRTVRFHQATSRTMRLLPGRLEVAEGDEGRTEIRFVDLPGKRPEVTFGRSAGEPLRHVQLRSATVSRQHARLVRDGQDWVIMNLSRTNPIVVNGNQLEGLQEQRTLVDGDRIEMGEVVFRYHAG